MVDPAAALTVFAVLALALAVLAWPGVGVVSRVRRRLASGRRVRLEDALKYIHTCERAGRPATVEGLAGTLGMGQGQAADLLATLIEARLVRPDDGGPTLTETGRETAVQTIRVHRLWERWLADRTGVLADEWHDRAERMEHRLTPDEAEDLSLRLGHPRFDPHGDPIPTRDGALPAREGQPLSTVSEDRVVKIRHLEDEPPEIYRRLVAEGLAPGLTAEVVGRDEDGVHLRTWKKVVTLDPMAAGNVTVAVLPEGSRAEPPRSTLAGAEAGRPVRVVGIAPGLHGPQRRRLLDLGLVKGTEVTPELVSATGDPVAYRVRGALIALRRDQARWIQVETAEAVEAAS